MLLAAFASPLAAQAPSASLSLEASVLDGRGEALRTVAVAARGHAPEPSRLYVSWDHTREACPADLADLPDEGGWAITDPSLDEVSRGVGPGPFDEEGRFRVEPGFVRLCAYLVALDEFGDELVAAVAAARALTVQRDPRAQLDREAAVAALIASPRVHRDVKSWIVQGERFDTVGLGVNGAGYIRFVDLTGDGRREAIARVSAGGAGRVHAYYIVSDHGGRIRVVQSVRDAFNGSIQRRGRGYREIIPRYASRDSLCCASRLRVWSFRWSGSRFVVASQRVVRTRFAEPARPAPARPAPRNRPSPAPAAPGDIYNCDDFPLSDGTTAQEYLRRFPSDPSRLDGDRDGRACE